MTNENLEQKIGLMEKFRGIARKTIGVYALALALGGMYGCEADKDNDTESCTSSGENGCNWDSCDNNEECKCSKPKGADDSACHCGCYYVHQPKDY